MLGCSMVCQSTMPIRSACLSLDFTRGPERMAWRIQDWLKSDGNSVGGEDDNTWAVATVLALAAGMVMSAFAGPAFEEASWVVKMFEHPEGTKPAE